jgi:hypothetical protein
MKIKKKIECINLIELAEQRINAIDEIIFTLRKDKKLVSTWIDKKEKLQDELKFMLS